MSIGLSGSINILTFLNHIDLSKLFMMNKMESNPFLNFLLEKKTDKYLSYVNFFSVNMSRNIVDNTFFKQKNKIKYIILMYKIGSFSDKICLIQYINKYMHYSLSDIFFKNKFKFIYRKDLYKNSDEVYNMFKLLLNVFKSEFKKISQKNKSLLLYNVVRLGFCDNDNKLLGLLINNKCKIDIKIFNFMLISYCNDHNLTFILKKINNFTFNDNTLRFFRMRCKMGMDQKLIKRINDMIITNKY